MRYYRSWLILLHSEIDTLFVFWGFSLPFMWIFKSEFLIQGLISRQNLILGVDNQIQIKFWKLKMLLLFNGLLDTFCFLLLFFTHPVFHIVCIFHIFPNLDLPDPIFLVLFSFVHFIYLLLSFIYFLQLGPADPIFLLSWNTSHIFCLFQISFLYFIHFLMLGPLDPIFK